MDRDRVRPRQPGRDHALDRHPVSRHPTAGVGRHFAQEPARSLRRCDRLVPGARRDAVARASGCGSRAALSTCRASQPAARLAARSRTDPTGPVQPHRKEQPMNRPTVLILAWAMPLAGCCGAALAAPAPQLSVHLADLLGDQPVLAPPAIHPARAAHASPIHRSAASKGAGPLARVDAAIRDAVREPSPDVFLGAVQVYPWYKRTVFRLYA